MIIIWGFRSIFKILGTVREYQCNRCNNVRRWEILRKTRFFTLFFIPIIPVSKKHFARCPVCNCAFELSKEQVAEYTQTQKDDFVQIR